MAGYSVPLVLFSGRVLEAGRGLVQWATGRKQPRPARHCDAFAGSRRPAQSCDSREAAQLAPAPSKLHALEQRWGAYRARCSAHRGRSSPPERPLDSAEGSLSAPACCSVASAPHCMALSRMRPCIIKARQTGPQIGQAQGVEFFLLLLFPFSFARLSHLAGVLFVSEHQGLADYLSWSGACRSKGGAEDRFPANAAISTDGQGLQVPST